MVDINWTVLPQIANFLILIFILNIIVYKPIRKILLERKSKIQGLTEGIESADQQAQDKDKSFSAGLREARVKGKQEKDALLQAASDEEKQILSRINDKAREDLAAVKDKIVKDTAVVKAALEKDVDAFADAISQKILGRAA